MTGGGRGIGARYCRGLAAEGARVVVADIALDAACDVAEQIEGLAVRVDVSDEASVRAMVQRAIGRYGRVDMLINNAAIFTELVQPRKAFDEISVEEWDRVMAVNVRGSWLCAKAVAPTFRAQRGGVIVNISSGTIFGGQVGFAHYVTSKAAVWGMARVLADPPGLCRGRLAGLTSASRSRGSGSGRSRAGRARSCDSQRRRAAARCRRRRAGRRGSRAAARPGRRGVVPCPRRRSRATACAALAWSWAWRSLA